MAKSKTPEEKPSNEQAATSEVIPKTVPETALETAPDPAAEIQSAAAAEPEVPSPESDDRPTEVSDEAENGGPTADPDRGHTDNPDISEPESLPASVAVEPQKPKSVFVPMILGGIFAAGLGAGATFYAVENGLFGVGSQDISALTAQLEEQQIQLKASQTAQADRLVQLEQLSSAAPDTAPFEALKAGFDSQLARLEIQNAALEQTLDRLAGRISIVEKRPIASDAGAGGTAAASAMEAYAAEIDAMRAALSEQQADVTASSQAAAEQLVQAEAQAQAIAESAQIQAAVLRFEAAVEGGLPFAAALAELSALNPTEVPVVISLAAAGGIPALSDVQTAFPAAARQALTASLPATAGEDMTSRLTAFLRAQVGARSLEARAGGDPDAVLSRTEAAVKSGDLAAALTQIVALPADGQAAMADWMALATARIETLDAARAFAQSLNQ